LQMVRFGELMLGAEERELSPEPGSEEIRSAKEYVISTLRADFLHTMLREKFLEPYVERFGRGPEVETFMAVLDTFVFQMTPRTAISDLLLYTQLFLDLPEERVRADLAALVGNRAIEQTLNGGIFLIGRGSRAIRKRRH
jgi:hypothetical protein